MAKFNIDEQTQLAEPIEITLEGKEYAVKKVSTELLRAVAAISQSEGVEAPIKQLGLLLGVDPAEFHEVDIRKIGKAIELITSSITESIGKPKNS